MLSLSCASCHGTKENQKRLIHTSLVWVKANMYQILLDFKNGKRTETMMQKHVKGFSDEELEQIAYYFQN